MCTERSPWLLAKELKKLPFQAPTGHEQLSTSAFWWALSALKDNYAADCTVFHEEKWQNSLTLLGLMGQHYWGALASNGSKLPADRCKPNFEDGQRSLLDGFRSMWGQGNRSERLNLKQGTVNKPLKSDQMPCGPGYMWGIFKLCLQILNSGIKSFLLQNADTLHQHIASPTGFLHDDAWVAKITTLHKKIIRSDLIKFYLTCKHSWISLLYLLDYCNTGRVDTVVVFFSPPFSYSSGDKDIDEYYTRKHHHPDFGGRGPTHMVKLNADPQQHQQRQRPRRVQRAMSQDHVLSPPRTPRRGDYGLSSYGVMAATAYGSSRHLSEEQLLSADRLHSQDPLLSPAMRRDKFREKAMARAMSHADMLMPTTPVMDRHKMTKMHSQPSASNDYNTLTVNHQATTSKRQAFASRRTHTVDHLQYIPGHHHTYHTASKNEVTV